MSGHKFSDSFVGDLEINGELLIFESFKATYNNKKVPPNIVETHNFYIRFFLKIRPHFNSI